MISDISSEKGDIKKTHKDKSLISENSKKKMIMKKKYVWEI